MYKLTFYYDEFRAERTGKTFDLNMNYDDPEWCSDESVKLIYLVSFAPSFKDYRPTTTRMWSWDMERLTVIDGMKEYLNCYKLKGCFGTSNSASHTDAEYARADRGDSEPGYLTDRIPYAMFNDGTLTFYFDLDVESREGKAYPTNANMETPEWVDDDTSFDVISSLPVYTGIS